MKSELIINGKKLKELVSSALEKKYEDISFEFNTESDFVIEVKQDHFIEHISFSDERILKELNLKELNLELDYVSIHENEYAFKVGAKDEELEYVFYCRKVGGANEC
ncbi:hypothetical protein O8C80_07200 [Aliarcobacter butzleri]|uniref:hypothetical protein n=1 Tax=Aliarcobacter butzleri TaxID=28197 RepID=UPI00263E5A6E|nr:hypothetical protein [Aliarcobacter butzleri]MDN5043124.1 hypothetical protein [Aliarcobacter butzleri]